MYYAKRKFFYFRLIQKNSLDTLKSVLHYHLKTLSPAQHVKYSMCSCKYAQYNHFHLILAIFALFAIFLILTSVTFYNFIINNNIQAHLKTNFISIYLCLSILHSIQPARTKSPFSSSICVSFIVHVLIVHSLNQSIENQTKSV